jgi:glutathione synthase/RimK-type ligase-like ATP-grasp enzyme
LNADDRLLASALEDLGLRADAVSWDDAGVDWPPYSAIVLRSTWDYHHRVAEFHAWIDRLAAAGAALWNAPSILRWNTNKRYLARMSHPILRPPPTVILDRGSAVDLGALLDARGWDEAVMKPAISADGFSTERTARSRAAADQAALNAMLAHGDVLIQTLVPEIRTGGEISLMFFGGVFSHAVNKRPQDGEFRVQERLGGRIVPTDPPRTLIDHARNLLESWAPGTLYARVDVVMAGENPILMEIELVEPSLYLAHDPPAAERLARAVQRIT